MQAKSLPHPYIGVHLRRNDWAFAHADTMPTVAATVAAIVKLARSVPGEPVKAVFLATDANPKDMAELTKGFAAASINIVRYGPPKAKHEPVWYPGFPASMPGSLIDYMSADSDLQYPVMDQLLCAHADIYVGTLVSGFSQQMHLERRRWYADLKEVGKLSGGAEEHESHKLGKGGSMTTIDVSHDWGHY